MDFIAQGIVRAVVLLAQGDPATYSAISATVSASLLSMTASLLLGIPLGYLLGFFTFPGRKAVRVVVDTLLALPTVFIGLVVYAFLSQRGPFGNWGLLFTIEAIAIGQTILALPVVIALTASAVESLDRSLRLTLMSLGASRRALFLSSLREARFGILAAAVTASGRVLTEVGISLMVGGNIKWHTRTITTAIGLETSKGDFALGIALGMVLLVMAFTVNFSLSFLRRREQG